MKRCNLKEEDSASPSSATKRPLYGYFMMSQAAQKAPLRFPEKNVLAAIVSFANTQGIAYPSNAHLAFRAGVGETTTRKARQRLEAQGWICTVEKSEGGRSSDGRGYTNRIKLNLPRLSQIANNPDWPRPKGGQVDFAEVQESVGSEPSSEQTRKAPPRESNASSGESYPSHREDKDNHQDINKEIKQQNHCAIPSPPIPNRSAVPGSWNGGECIYFPNGVMAKAEIAIRTVLTKYGIGGTNLQTLPLELAAIAVSAAEVESIAQRIGKDLSVRSKSGALVRVLEKMIRNYR